MASSASCRPETAGEPHQGLRACANVKDGYEFQQELLTRLLEVENDRHAFGRAAKRVRNGKAPQAGTPEPRSGLDPADLETWQLEYNVCERLARQGYRCVGDALAWRVFGYQRGTIIALCQTAWPGMMAGKERAGRRNSPASSRLTGKTASSRSCTI